MEAIRIKNLTYRYPDGSLALDNLSLNIRVGKKTVILGANGSGKSTLLSHLNGLILAQEGEVYILGERVDKKNLDSIRRKLGLVFDNPDDQLFSINVMEDIAFGPRNLGYTGEDLIGLVNKSMEVLGIGNLANKSPYNLSLGQKRKAAIGGVLAMEPRIMVFDEPFSGLDPGSLRNFLEVLNRLHLMGHSLVITTHNVDIAYEWADDIIILKSGKLAGKGGIDIMEDRNFMEDANLSLPIIYELFGNLDKGIRTKKEAKKFIEALVNSKEV